MKDEVFSSVRPELDDSGRVIVVARSWQQVRLRSMLTWVGCHWIHEHVLCGGSKCAACAAGYPKRTFAFASFDRPGNTTALLRFTASDAALFSSSAKRSVGERVIGDAWKICRPGDRKPLAIEFVKHCPELLEIPQDVVMLEVLRLHRIQATAGDVRERSFYGLISRRISEACGQSRLSVHS